MEFSLHHSGASPDHCGVVYNLHSKYSYGSPAYLSLFLKEKKKKAAQHTFPICSSLVFVPSFSSKRNILIIFFLISEKHLNHNAYSLETLNEEISKSAIILWRVGALFLRRIWTFYSRFGPLKEMGTTLIPPKPYKTFLTSFSLKVETSSRIRNKYRIS